MLHAVLWATVFTASLAAMIGVMLAFRRRMIDDGAAAVQQFAEDILPLVLATGKNIAGPPTRPLPRIELEIDGGEVFAIGVHERTV
ncbi:hypothetical protein BE15_00510 [Sorangium cellulosum]|uniref:Uncharacterized protein n=1 Tax=Sorangium cellulosum TaxID=56 RepID=A0A150PXM7_SORCE|nr:hypothetical protein BE15_00510 [Sorangium cellulosum]